MTTLALFSLSLTVALGMAWCAPRAAQNPVTNEDDVRPVVGEGPPVLGGVVVDDPAAPATRKRYCHRVVLQGKCYQFFKQPKKAQDAECFCQENFAGGHLASITSSQIHRGVMDLIQKHNGGYTSTWVGGLRYLETGRFMWLDGARWSYADWASGEPNNSSSREDCLELMADGNGQFNDLGCQVPLAYICSYPNQ